MGSPEGRGCPQAPRATNRAPVPQGERATPWASSLKGYSAPTPGPGEAARKRLSWGLLAEGAAWPWEQFGGGRGRCSVQRGLHVHGSSSVVAQAVAQHRGGCGAPGAARRQLGQRLRAEGAAWTGALFQQQRPGSTGLQDTAQDPVFPGPAEAGRAQDSKGTPAARQP